MGGSDAKATVKGMQRRAQFDAVSGLGRDDGALAVDAPDPDTFLLLGLKIGVVPAARKRAEVRRDGRNAPIARRRQRDEMNRKDLSGSNALDGDRSGEWIDERERRRLARLAGCWTMAPAPRLEWALPSKLRRRCA